MKKSLMNKSTLKILSLLIAILIWGRRGKCTGPHAGKGDYQDTGHHCE